MIEAELLQPVVIETESTRKQQLEDALRKIDAKIAKIDALLEARKVET